MRKAWDFRTATQRYGEFDASPRQRIDDSYPDRSPVAHAVLVHFTFQSDRAGGEDPGGERNAFVFQTRRILKRDMLGGLVQHAKTRDDVGAAKQALGRNVVEFAEPREGAREILDGEGGPDPDLFANKFHERRVVYDAAADFISQTP